MIQAKK
jgi:hypothetical protein